NGNGRKNTAVVLKTLKPEERSIVNVLDAHGGTYLQKYIAREAGLSRLKTHRVVARCRSAESSRLRSTETRTRLSLRSGYMTVCINHETFPSDRYEIGRASCRERVTGSRVEV